MSTPPEATRQERVRAVLAQALDTAPTERARFLDDTCGDDVALREEVAALLGQLDTRGGFPDSGPGRALREAADPSFTRRSDDPGLPAHVGPYEIMSCLGEGGMGVVYEARQRHPRRRVAVKVLQPSHVTPALISRFRREAELLGRLKHPGIAGVLEATEGRLWGPAGPELPYIVMELVDGLPLTTHAARNGLSAAQRLELLARTCDAVQHAHERGVLHRDLKPANVLVDETGQPRVLDFGVARALDSDVRAVTAHTGTSQLVGTLPYMSPEQVSGHAHDIGPTSDVYALGVLGYELLSGRLPLPLAGLSLIDAIRCIREEDPPRLATLDPALAGDPDAIIGRALDKEPSRRYASAAEMAADIRRHLQDQPILARPPSSLYRVQKYVRRNRTVVGFAIAFVALLIAGLAVTSYLFVREAHSKRQAVLAGDDARRASYRAQLGAAQVALRDGDARSARQFLEKAPVESREWAWHHLASRLDDAIDVAKVGDERGMRVVRRDDGALVTICRTRLAIVTVKEDRLHVDSTREGEFVEISSDGRLALATGADWLLHDTTTDAAPTHLGPVRETVVGALPDGGFVVVAGTHVTSVGARNPIDLKLGAPLQGDASVPWRVSPDSRWLVSRGWKGAEIVALAAGARPRSLGGQADVVAFDPKGSVLLASDDAGVVRALRTDTLAPHAWDHVQASRTRLNLLAVDPAGRRLLSVDRTGVVRLWDFATGQPLGTFANVGYASARSLFTPDGSAILTPEANGGLRTLSVEDGAPLGSPRLGHGAPVVDVAWLPGSRIASLDASGELRLFIAPGAPEPTRLVGHSNFVYGVDISADGSRLASVAWDSTVRLWDGRTGAPLHVMKNAMDTGRVVRFRPDGLVLMASSDQGAIAFDVASGVESARADCWAPHAIDFDAKGEQLVLLQGDGVVSGWTPDLQGPSWEVPLADHIDEHDRGAGDARAMDLGDDGRDAVVAYGAMLLRIEVPSGHVTWALRNARSDCLDVARDDARDRVAVACRNGTVLLVAASSGQILRDIEVPGGAVLAVALHPDGTLLATGSVDGAVQLWDADRGEILVRLRPHDDYVRDLVFSRDGTRLLSASGDTTVHVTDTLSVRERLVATTAP